MIAGAILVMVVLLIGLDYSFLFCLSNVFFELLNFGNPSLLTDGVEVRLGVRERRLGDGEVRLRLCNLCLRGTDEVSICENSRRDVQSIRELIRRLCEGVARPC